MYKKECFLTFILKKKQANAKKLESFYIFMTIRSRTFM